MGNWDEATAARYWQEQHEVTTMAKKSDPQFQFTFEGRQYELDFTREHHWVSKFTGETPEGEPVYVKDYTTFPSTTVRILEVDGSVERGKWLSFRTATVGCWHRERYHRDKGREHALRLVMKTLPPGMHIPMWKCYLTRTRGSSIKDRIISLQSQLKVLNAQQEALYTKRK